MVKRAAEDSEGINAEGQASAKSQTLANGATTRRSLAPADPGMGEFEDEWEDDVDSEDEIVVAQDKEDGDEDAMEVDGEIQPAAEDEDGPPPEDEVFIPGIHQLEKDEVLEADQSVYQMLHHMNVTWPCLSFDVLKDSRGDERRSYPETIHVVTGTQADQASKNEVIVMKMSQLHKTQRDSDDSESDDEDDANSVDEDAILEYRSIPHQGGVNRIRAQSLPANTSLPPVSQPYYAASWAETGKVHIWDIRPIIEALEVPGSMPDKARTHRAAFTVTAHGRAEGFAMDWSAPGPSSQLRLLTGDIHSKIHLTTLTPSGFNTASQPFASHTSSVEDIQWSPSEATVFASCSADQSVRMWDVRMKARKNIVGITKAHESDVNVISWNRGTSYLLVSGGDEGAIKVWDLRSLKGTSSSSTPVASFAWHNAPITSIEWHPTEDSIFAASGADDQVTLWDLSVEQDDEEVGLKEIKTASGEKLKDVPPQLLFVHQGQKDVKEIHWHPQIPGCVVSTALDGFNVFKTISV
ncbi:ribosome biosynthesis protein rrb1 [Tulasnella sp. JGI-2019a]|nr:ribosome biosynthesis protein rrb1 [Tulasnella sp. JGI-2019a]